jgi:hypothetical protein
MPCFPLESEQIKEVTNYGFLGTNSSDCLDTSRDNFLGWDNCCYCQCCGSYRTRSSITVAPIAHQVVTSVLDNAIGVNCTPSSSLSTLHVNRCPEVIPPFFHLDFDLVDRYRLAVPFRRLTERLLRPMISPPDSLM